MNKLLKVMIIMVAVSGLASAQVWTYVEDVEEGPSPHGVVVDPDGKLWIAYYGYTDTLFWGDDTIRTCRISVYNAAGTEASFSPILYTVVDGDSSALDGSRGISLDQNGNILDSDIFGVFRFNYQTGEAIQHVKPSLGIGLTEAAVSDDGHIFLAGVVPQGSPIEVYDSDFELVNTVVDSNFIISRTLLVNGDGTDLFHGVIYGSLNGIVHYHSDDGPEGTWEVVDTLYASSEKLLWAQCMDWDNNGLLWVGTYWNVADDDFNGWYALDPTQSYFAVDTIGHNANTSSPPAVGETPPAGGTYYAPRGLAFTSDGLTAYTADFDGGVVKKWTNSDPAVPGDPVIVPELSIDHERGNPIIAVEFTLHQNYPNPFNPATTIPFDLKDAGLAKLVVYDVAGREVATLVNEPKTPGTYRVLFDASELPSGMYIYQLEFKNRTVSKRMTYVK